MMRNRRIGTSLTGITQFLATHGMNTFIEWCKDGYKEIQRWDAIYSDWLCIPRSIKTTSIKPSGCCVPETIIRTNKGPMTMTEIFKHYRYDLEGHRKILSGASEKDISTGDKFHFYNPNSKKGGDSVGGDSDDKPIPYNKVDKWLISNVRGTGDKIMVYNKNNVLEPISALYINGNDEVYEINTEKGKIMCTSDHKFLINVVEMGVPLKIWLEAQYLNDGDDIVEFSSEAE
jgi:hypothetical protein